MLAFPLLFLLAQAPAPPVATPEPTPRPTPNGPVVVLETSMGNVKIGLHQDKTPRTVKNFLNYVRMGHFDGTVFHRVIPGFMVQGGGFLPDMTERKETLMPPVVNEARLGASAGLRNSRGTVAMARTNDPNSAQSQFFVNVKDNHRLDFGIGGAGYAVFGEVLEGMDVVDRIVAVPTGTKGMHQNVPLKPVLINRARELPAPKPAAKP
ncbi:MAG: peptidyl-prolyl cis-trans isomerase [Vicinamibacteria bacterium]|nr:peptidyl-prolyl cis-trans isomerase [Vicinamibacteria bacterium]